jgi:hypothetical protein
VFEGEGRCFGLKRYPSFLSFVSLLFLLVVLLSSSCYVLVSMLFSLRLIILEY